LVVLPKHTRKLLLQAQLLGVRQHDIKKSSKYVSLMSKFGTKLF